MSPYSTIRKKTCKCSDTCNKPVSFGFDGYFYAHAPQEIKDRQGMKAKRTYQNKLSRNREAILSRKVHSVGVGTKKILSGNPEPLVKSGGNKSALMGIADKVFGDFVKNRDKNEKNEIKCPCCGKWFNLDAKTDNGEAVVNAMHFVNRNVYSLRYSEVNVWAGDCYCNSRQHQKPKGKEYQNFRKFLVEKVGEEEVVRMENSRRNINKLSEGDLRDIINLYSSKLKK